MASKAKMGGLGLSDGMKVKAGGSASKVGAQVERAKSTSGAKAKPMKQCATDAPAVLRGQDKMEAYKRTNN